MNCLKELYEIKKIRKYNFLPYSYKEKRNRVKIYIVNIIIATLIIINLSYVYVTINRYNEIDAVKEEIKNINYSIYHKLPNYSKDTWILNSTEDFFQYTKELKFESLTVENKVIHADIVLHNKDEYEKIVKYLEGNPSWKITKLSPLQDQSEGFSKFQVTMEVKN